jgi:hypothetical protein
MISVLIPTIRGSLANTLISTGLQTSKEIGEVIILDEGDKSVMSDIATRYAVDMLTLKGKEVRHIRRLKTNIVRSRFDLIVEAKNLNCLFLDDDNVMDSNCIEILLPHLKRGVFVTPAIVQVNNEIGWKHYDSPKSFYAPQDVLQGLWEVQWRNTREENVVKVKQTSTNCVLFNREGIAFRDLLRVEFAEDQAFCKCFKQGGIVVTNAVSYHFMMNDEKRRWANIAEDILRKKAL